MQLDLGAGDIRTEGYKSVDISDKCKPDYIWDITKLPYPKEWEGAEGVRIDNVCEHIEPYTLIKVINEIHRIMKVGGILWSRLPLLKLTEKNFDGVFTDPTHVNQFTKDTFYYWDKNHRRCKIFGKDYGIIPWTLLRNEEWKDNDKFLIVELQK